MVLDTNSHDLTRAQRRAYVHSLTATCVGCERHGYNGSEFYDVASFSTPGLMHRVRLDFTADGIDAHCDCMAGQNNVICQHVAAALEASVALSEPEPERPSRLDGRPSNAELGLTTDWFRARLGGN